MVKQLLFINVLYISHSHIPNYWEKHAIAGSFSGWCYHSQLTNVFHINWMPNLILQCLSVVLCLTHQTGFSDTLYTVSESPFSPSQLPIIHHCFLYTTSLPFHPLWLFPFWSPLIPLFRGVWLPNWLWGGGTGERSVWLGALQSFGRAHWRGGDCWHGVNLLGRRLDPTTEFYFWGYSALKYHFGKVEVTFTSYLPFKCPVKSQTLF